ncbi:hypothetical protein EYF80_038740 [Liparis tanakae]|uniref:Uncharacterized protein n=1 Tax=Liparis tanakae TaxID=230148 RepID=A0A4Z2GCF9_9TELE|nr:hypothetical protein EYF80_038740 [Liparis tanakae]
MPTDIDVKTLLSSAHESAADRKTVSPGAPPGHIQPVSAEPAEREVRATDRNVDTGTRPLLVKGVAVEEEVNGEQSPVLEWGPAVLHQGQTVLHQGPTVLHQGQTVLHQGPTVLPQGPTRAPLCSTRAKLCSTRAPLCSPRAPPGPHQGPTVLHQGPTVLPQAPEG